MERWLNSEAKQTGSQIYCRSPMGSPTKSNGKLDLKLLTPQKMFSIRTMQEKGDNRIEMELRIFTPRWVFHQRVTESIACQKVRNEISNEIKTCILTPLVIMKSLFYLQPRLERNKTACYQTISPTIWKRLKAAKEYYKFDHHRQ